MTYDLASDVAWVKQNKAQQVKREAYYRCYPMVKHVDDPLHAATWDTFSHIWDLAITSMEMQ